MGEVESGGQPAQQDQNHKFFTNEIDDEVAGFHERGVKHPQVSVFGFKWTATFECIKEGKCHV